MRTHASATAITPSDVVTFRRKPARKYGSMINRAMENITENVIVPYISHFSSFSFCSSVFSFPGFFASSSSSSIKLAEYIRHRIPTTKDSKKEATPRKTGSFQMLLSFAQLLYGSTFTSISPSGFLTPMEY